VSATTTFTNMAPENRNATCSLVVNDRLLRRTMVFLGANARDVVTSSSRLTLRLEHYGVLKCCGDARKAR
jgi:hypothetical protein